MQALRETNVPIDTQCYRYLYGGAVLTALPLLQLYDIVKE